MKRVTGIGGIFFKCQSPDKMKNWYQKHLGLETDAYGTSFEWRHAEDANKKGYTAWSPFKKDSDYFGKADQDYMINYRVENLEALVDELRKEGVEIVDKIDSFEYGKFVHIVDLEGNRIELWEPVDEEYDKILEVRTK
ncbi:MULTISPECIES: VOC family protein [unclassified Lentimicrobium]|uniref:VOC family protein n=1 Tax=unclassified Lentimicrobium TaxID=2677434 RepID=UPI0015575DDD|nr:MULTISPECIES: VOC family protein [unclassified Lentimicrobium]NPD48057.1 VOC family protein [Lentimicrobium sp. S6]NPD86539.1 VOC family protein [Lentimicrobium sp. L6]